MSKQPRFDILLEGFTINTLLGLDWFLQGVQGDCPIAIKKAIHSRVELAWRQYSKWHDKDYSKRRATMKKRTARKTKKA